MIGWLLSDALPWIIGGAGALLTLVLGIVAVRRDAKEDARQETALQAAERMAKQHKVRDEIDSDIRPANAADELRRDWSK